MAYLIKLGVQYINFINEYADPRVENWFLVSSAFPSLVAFLSYYYFLFNIGLNIMKTRQPYNLDVLLIIYNGIQILACMYVVYECWHVINFNLSAYCHDVDFTNNGLRALKVCYVYFLIKVFDLGDTIFFVLRKKENQITFLHLYHHGGMTVMTWAITKFYGGGSILLIPFLNSIVHIFMYTYYLLAVYMKGNEKLTRFKKNITQMQLVQFFVLIIFVLRVAIADNCNIPSWPAWALFVQNIFIISLFLDFYLKTYVYKKKMPVTTDLNKDNQHVHFRNAENMFQKHEKKI